MNEHRIYSSVVYEWTNENVNDALHFALAMNFNFSWKSILVYCLHTINGIQSLNT